MSDQALRPLVARLKRDGYVPTHWIPNSKGMRADLGGKLAIPSHYTKSRICRIHGNLVKVRHETSPGANDRGVRILDVLPCLFCCQDPEGVIGRSPKTH